MRKVREGGVQFRESTYCFSNGVATKKQGKEVYPFLEKQCKQLTADRADLEKKLSCELAVLAKLMKEGKLVGGELDVRVAGLMKEYELNSPDE